MPPPAISVVMVDLAGEVAESMRALRDQGPPEQIELVLVSEDGDAMSARRRYPELEAFGSWTCVSSGAAVTSGAVIAAGMRAATAPILAFCEDHVLPETDWVRSRLEAHAAGAVVVGGVLRNANPGPAVSWATFLRAFGPFAVPVAGGRTVQLPWHQCSYRREVLPLGPELDGLLDNEGLLHTDLDAQGHVLALEGRCVVSHLNPSIWRSLVVSSWAGGQVWGAGRAAHARWSALARVRQCALVPHTIVRELRLRLADLERVRPERRRRVIPALAVATVIHALGEAAGVLFGVGAAGETLADVELNRYAHLRAGETLTAP